MTTYQCKECKAPVSVKNGNVFKTCTCEAAIIANITAVAYGRSHVASETK